MLPRSWRRLADSKSNSSTRLPRTTTTRVSSGWVASISILLAIDESLFANPAPARSRLRRRLRSAATGPRRKGGRGGLRPAWGRGQGVPRGPGGALSNPSSQNCAWPLQPEAGQRRQAPPIRAYGLHGRARAIPVIRRRGIRFGRSAARLAPGGLAPETADPLAKTRCKSKAGVPDARIRQHRNLKP